MNQKQKEIFDRIDKSLNEAIHLTKGLFLEANKEPCQHEPKDIIARQEGPGRISFCIQDFTSMYYCKHCGVKIKAEKWVEG